MTASSPTSTDSPSIWSTLREAVRGSRLWCWEIPLAWVLAYPLGFGPTGVFIAVSVAFSTLALVSGWLFSKGNWKTKRV